jgi:hypothetical protein
MGSYGKSGIYLLILICSKKAASLYKDIHENI